MNTKHNSITLFEKAYEKFDLVQHPSICSSLLQKKITDKFIIINFQKNDIYGYTFLICFDLTLVITNKSTFPVIQQLFKDNKISLIYYIPNNSYEIIREQISDSIQLKEIFIKKEQILSFLQNARIMHNNSKNITKYEYETIAAHLLQKCYIKSRIDRVENIDELSQPPAKIPNITMNDFIDICMLGSGSCGYVYLMYNHKEEKLYAIKKQNENDLESEKLQRREISNYELFCHPFLPRFYGTPDNKCVVIDFIEGCTLKNIGQQHLDFYEKNIIIMEILLTFQYFHSKKYIYRDLKPNNVIIDQNKNAVIIDFDRIIFDTENKGEDTTANFGGNYIAPEVVLKEQFSTKADIYSIGQLIYYIFKEEEPKSSHPNLFEPELSEISEIIEDCTKEEPSKRPEISELIIKMMKYFLKNIKEYESNHFLMEKYLRIIEKCNISEQVKKELDNVYSMISNIYSIFNNFQQSFNKHEIKVKNQYLQEILYKFNFYYYDDSNEQEENYPEFQKESSIIVIDECEVYKSKYSIICLNYKLMIIKENIKSETHFINDFISKHNKSEIFYLKDGNQEFLDEISTFSKHFQIDNNEFRSLFNLIIRCIISFLLKKSYNDRETKHYEEDDKIIINNDIPDESFIIIREDAFEQMKETSLIYYIPLEEIMIMKRAYESEEDKEREKYNIINIPLMNRYYGYIEREEYKKYYLFEYIKGETLDKYDKNKLTYNEKCNIILKIILAIRYFKSKGIVYEYLFPNNIIIDKDKEPILKHYEITTKHFNYESLTLSNETKHENIIQPDFYYLGYLIYYLMHNEQDSMNNFKNHSIINKCIALNFKERPTSNELIKIFHQENSSQICNKEIFESNLFLNDEIISEEGEKNKLICSLGFISAQEIFQPRNISKAIHYYSLAANQNYSKAQLNLGNIYLNGDVISRDIDKAIHYYSLAANQNNSSAQFNLGVIYSNGDGVSRDIDKTIHYYSLAANQNHSKAQFNLGVIYSNGDGVSRDIDKAIHYYSLAANQNHSDAQFNLGVIYDEGDGVSRDIDKAIHYYSLAANQNHSDAQFNLGVIYDKGDGVSRDIDKAIHYYSLAANQNDSHAQFNLGVIYSNGDGVSRDIDKAIHYYSLAANQNHSHAQFNLGVIYSNGDGVSRDIDKAIHYYSLAANQNHSDAQFNLGVIYSNGDGVSRDIDKAIHYYSLAANQNHSHAQLNLGVIYDEGDGVSRDIDKAIHYYSLAANQNHSDAQFNLGVIYDKGDGVSRDIDKAIHYYSLAANQNHSHAQLNLGVIYYKGDGVSRDIDKAIHYYSLAANQNDSHAQFYLGVIYDEGDGISRDIDKAIHYYSLAANQNDSHAQFNLGVIYDEGDGVSRDIDKAIHYYSLAANQNHSHAQFNLGVIYSNGDGVSRDIDKAIHYFSLAANQNHSDAQFNLGLFYYEGDGVSRDIKKAIYYYSLSAEQNQPDANFYLGSIYYEGLYVTSDIDKAIHYFKEASCFDHSRAKNNLGIIRKTGKGLPENICNSVEYFEEAIRQKGDEVAMFNLAHIHLYEEFHKSNLDKAIELLVKPAINKIEFSFDLLCLAVIEKYEALNISEIEKDFEKIDKERGSKLAKRVYVEIKFQLTHDPAYYEKTYNKLKGINLVYYGNKIENQTEKKKIEYIDPRPKTNKLFYEGLGDI
ncbi:hypothetical protein M9Y10_037150 [Tritrichomonas musculus]|uniref:Protein kinase domain-containing protein n=1 Tax=Tritrichomonas musculus TaxID=1915356 RepID=A0ABR2GT33_9EUKA